MLEDILETVLPNALMIGVDYELFWTLTPKSLSPFIKAFQLKQEYDDMVAWNTGNYIRIAIASSFDKATKYPSKPVTYKSVEESPEVRQARIKEKFMQQMKLVNTRFRKEEINGE